MFANRYSNAVLWREIGTGLAFALVGLVMMALAVGAAGVAQPASDAQGDPTAVAHTPAPSHRLEIYQEPADPFAWGMPIP